LIYKILSIQEHRHLVQSNNLIFIHKNPLSLIKYQYRDTNYINKPDKHDICIFKIYRPLSNATNTGVSIVLKAFYTSHPHNFYALTCSGPLKTQTREFVKKIPKIGISWFSLLNQDNNLSQETTYILICLLWLARHRSMRY